LDGRERECRVLPPFRPPLARLGAFPRFSSISPVVDLLVLPVTPTIERNHCSAFTENTAQWLRVKDAGTSLTLLTSCIACQVSIRILRAGRLPPPCYDTAAIIGLGRMPFRANPLNRRLKDIPRPGMY
jgi:hypothetical protein